MKFNHKQPMVDIMKCNPQGIFQTKERVGVLISVFKTPKGLRLSYVFVHNDCRGENTALDLMKKPYFCGWAIDPWTGQINIQIT